jgi:hypothetical protein
MTEQMHQDSTSVSSRIQAVPVWHCDRVVTKSEKYWLRLANLRQAQPMEDALKLAYRQAEQALKKRAASIELWYC